jgi:transposase InsO family protein
MPWRETSAVEEREQFVTQWLEGEGSKSALCRRYGITRRTGDKWLERYQAAGLAGLLDRSRAPHHHSNQVSEAVVAVVVAARRRHPYWGPRKLLAWLGRQSCGPVGWPSASTVGEWLRREGLTVPRKRRRRAERYTAPFSSCGSANAVWCVDFKGWFKTGDGRRCDPLTLSDAWSRYLLRCQAVADTGYEATRGVLEAAFREYGLPRAMRSDNGTPFASRGVCGLSRLSVWWLKLGIVPERIEAGAPQQNGRHERMHRTLKAETAQPPRDNRRAQQRAFDRFRREYNEERPHESLGQVPPGSVYESSPRLYPDRLAEVEYASGWVARRVEQGGHFYWRGREVFLSEALGGERIGLEALDERYWMVYFTVWALGVYDGHLGRMMQTCEVSRVGLVREALGRPFRYAPGPAEGPTEPDEVYTM